MGVQVCNTPLFGCKCNVVGVHGGAGSLIIQAWVISVATGRFHRNRDATEVLLIMPKAAHHPYGRGAAPTLPWGPSHWHGPLSAKTFEHYIHHIGQNRPKPAVTSNHCHMLHRGTATWGGRPWGSPGSQAGGVGERASRRSNPLVTCSWCPVMPCACSAAVLSVPCTRPRARGSAISTA
jgi:hypothetical protein